MQIFLDVAVVRHGEFPVGGFRFRIDAQCVSASGNSHHGGARNANHAIATFGIGLIVFVHKRTFEPAVVLGIVGNVWIVGSREMVNVGVGYWLTSFLIGHLAFDPDAAMQFDVDLMFLPTFNHVHEITFQIRLVFIRMKSKPKLIRQRQIANTVGTVFVGHCLWYVVKNLAALDDHTGHRLASF